MRSLLRVLVRCVLLAFPLAACGSAVDGTSDQGAAAVTDCKDVRSTPTKSVQQDGSGNLVTTTFSIDASGCIAGDTPASKLVDELVALVQDDAKLAAVTSSTGKIFSKYSAHGASGQLESATGRSRTIDVTFNASKSPSTTLKVTLKKSANGELSFRLTNTAGIGVFFFTAVDAGGLDVRLTVKPTPTGVSIAGTTKIVANPGYEDNLKDMNDLPALVIHWLKEELAAASH